MAKKQKSIEPLSWSVDGPAFRNRTALISIAVAMTITVGLTGLFMLGITIYEENYEFFVTTLKIVGGIWIGTLVMMYGIGFIFFGRKVTMEVTIDRKGVTQTMKNKAAGAANKLAVIAGLVGGGSRGATTAGAGLIAQSRQTQGVGWDQVASLRITNPEIREIQLRSEWRPLLVLHLPEDIYETALERIRQGIETRGIKPRPDRIPTGIRALIGLAAALFGAYLLLPFPFELPAFFLIGMTVLALAIVIVKPRIRPLLGWLLVAGIFISVTTFWKNNPPMLYEPGARSVLIFQMLILAFFPVLGLIAGLGKLTPKRSRKSEPS